MPVKTTVNFTGLIKENSSVSNSTCLQLLQTCISKNRLLLCRQIHSHIKNKLINMYIKCCNLADARQMFDQMREPDVVSWNTVISAYRRHGYAQEVLSLFYQMQQSCVDPDQFTFASILPACAKIRALEHGVKIHQIIMERGYLSDVVVASALMDMYAKCGSIHAARELFDKIPQRNVISWNAMLAGYTQNSLLHKALEIFKDMPERDVVSWNTLIAGYAQNGYAENALETFKEMQLTNVKPDSTTFASVLPACARIGDSKQRVDIHQAIIETGSLSDVAVASALVDMYAKGRSIRIAREVFDKMPYKNVVSWSTMIAGYVQNSFLDEALKLFEEMPHKDVVSWTAIIAGYAQNGFAEKALETFKQMQLAGIKPDSATLASILPVCAKMGALEQGIAIHHSIIGSKYLSDVAVTSALVDMYAKCGSMDLARELFDKIRQRNVVSWTSMIAGYAQNGVLDEALMLFNEMPNRDVISWNALIAGYAQNGFVEKALETFKQMHLTGIKPDSNTFVSILPACAKLGALGQGMTVHQSIIESGFLSNVVVASALVDMYAKCGSIHMASELFDRMPQRSVISWNIMIAGYAQNSFCKDALKLFELMKHSGTRPNHVSFACVLFACGNSGLVDEACKHFDDMTDSYCITPTVDHYVCMSDLLGRAGYLEETLKFIIKMPIKPVVVVWTCLLGACGAFKNIKLGIFTATILFEMDPYNVATYVLLSNIYAEVGRWGDVQMIRRLMRDRGIKKIPGCSWVEGHKMVHAFCVGE